MIVMKPKISKERHDRLVKEVASQLCTLGGG